MTDTVPISGVMLRKQGEHVIVEVEIDGCWREAIREHESGAFSHIAEPAGMRAGTVSELWEYAGGKYEKPIQS